MWERQEATVELNGAALVFSFWVNVSHTDNMANCPGKLHMLQLWMQAWRSCSTCAAWSSSIFRGCTLKRLWAFTDKDWPPRTRQQVRTSRSLPCASRSAQKKTNMTGLQAWWQPLHENTAFHRSFMFTKHHPEKDVCFYGKNRHTENKVVFMLSH